MARLREGNLEAEGKPSVNSAIKSQFRDPKPGELPMSRLNSDEDRREDRTDMPFNTFG